jgi:dTDP-4-dehydrorhamnose 3,5-epimerase
MEQLLNGAAALTTLKIIPNPKGNILHALKQSEATFENFGEAYFSFVEPNVFKGWKMHTRMLLNLVVPVGAVEFYIINGKEHSCTSIILSQDNYKRLTVYPGNWLGFKGIGSSSNMLLNIASLEHDPDEAEQKAPEYFLHLFPSLQL